MNYLARQLSYYLPLFILVLGMSTFSTKIIAQEDANIVLMETEFTAKGVTAWKEGVVVSNFMFRALDNKRFKLYDLLDKVLVIEFWNPESTTGKKNQENLKQLHGEFDINVISICSDKFEDQLSTLVSQENLPWAVICDNYHRFNGKSFTATHKVGNASYVVITPDRKVRAIAEVTNIVEVEKTLAQFAKKQQ